MFDRMPSLPPMIMRAITAGTLGGLDLLKTTMRFLSPRGLFWFVNATAAWATGTDVIVRGHRGRRISVSTCCPSGRTRLLSCHLFIYRRRLQNPMYSVIAARI